MQAAESSSESRVSPIARELAAKIKAKKFAGLTWKILLTLDDPIRKIMQLFGRLNLEILDRKVEDNTGGFFSSKKVEACTDFYNSLTRIVTEISNIHLDNLIKNQKLTLPAESLLGKRSAYESCLPLRFEIFNYTRLFLSLHAYPFYLARIKKFDQIISQKKEEPTPGFYSKKLQKHHLENIVWLYRFLGRNTEQSLELSLMELIDLEMTIVQYPCTRHKLSWRDCIKAWAKHPDWGGKEPEIKRIADEFLKIQQLTPLLKDKTPVASSEKFNLTPSSRLSDELSFFRYIQQVSLHEIYCDVLNTKGVSFDQFPEEFNQFFLDKLSNETSRQLAIFLLNYAFNEYGKIPKMEKRNFSYEPYRQCFKNSFDILKTFTHKNHGGEFHLEMEHHDVYELLFICFLMLHLGQLFTEFPLDRKIILFKMLKGLSFKEREKLYFDLYHQIPIARNLCPDVAVNEILEKYPFSIKRQGLLLLREGFYFLGLRPHIPKGPVGLSYDPLDFGENFKFLKKFEEFCRCKLSEDAVFFLLFFQHLDKNESEVLNEIKKNRDEILKNYLNVFFLPRELKENIKSYPFTLFKEYRLPKNMLPPPDILQSDQEEKIDLNDNPNFASSQVVDIPNRHARKSKPFIRSYDIWSFKGAAIDDALELDDEHDISETTEVDDIEELILSEDEQNYSLSWSYSNRESLPKGSFLEIENQKSSGKEMVAILKNFFEKLQDETPQFPYIEKSEEKEESNFTDEEEDGFIKSPNEEEITDKMIECFNIRDFKERICDLENIVSGAPKRSLLTRQMTDYTEEEKISAAVVASKANFQTCLIFSTLSEQFSPLKFLHLAFDNGVWLYDKIAEWSKQNCCVLEELVPGMRAIRTDVYWKKKDGNYYFRILINFISSICLPESQQLDVELNIPRSRLWSDNKLRLILHLFFPLCFDFNSLEAEDTEEEKVEKKEVTDCLSFDDLLKRVCPELRYLWNRYEASDKEWIGENLFEFLSELRKGIRKKMLSLALSPQEYIGIQSYRLALQGNVYMHENFISLLPLSHPQSKNEVFSIHKLKYESHAQLLLEDLKLKRQVVINRINDIRETRTEINKIFCLGVAKTLEDIEASHMENIGVSYEVKAVLTKDIESLLFLESDFKLLKFAQLAEALKETEKGKEKNNKFPIEEVKYNFNQRKEDVENNIVREVWCIVEFYFESDPKISYKVIYKEIPKNPEMIYWQLMQLKHQYYKYNNTL